MGQPIAIVFGVGTTRGVGGAVCKRFAQEGYHVIVTGRTLEKIQEVVADIWSSRDGSAGALQTDVTVEEQVIAAFDLAMSPGTGRAAAKAGLRTVSQSMAREYGPKGIHVAHVVIDGGILGDRLRNAAPAMVEALGSDGLLGYEAIAENYWMLHRQPRSAWTQELDIRPYKENW